LLSFSGFLEVPATAIAAPVDVTSLGTTQSGGGSHKDCGNSNSGQNINQNVNTSDGQVLDASTVNQFFLDQELLAASSRQDLLNFTAELEGAVKQLQQMLSNLHQK
jgi:hypothetical protein